MSKNQDIIQAGLWSTCQRCMSSFSIALKQLQAVISNLVLPYLDLQAADRALEGFGRINILPKMDGVVANMQQLQCHCAKHATG